MSRFFQSERPKEDETKERLVTRFFQYLKKTSPHPTKQMLAISAYFNSFKQYGPCYWDSTGPKRLGWRPTAQRLQRQSEGSRDVQDLGFSRRRVDLPRLKSREHTQLELTWNWMA